jgi:hypothetical protein
MRPCPHGPDRGLGGDERAATTIGRIPLSPATASTTAYDDDDDDDDDCGDEADIKDGQVAPAAAAVFGSIGGMAESKRAEPKASEASAMAARL